MPNRLLARVEISDPAWARKQGVAATKATLFAVNRSAIRGRAVAIEQLADELGLPQRALRVATLIRPANESTLAANVEARGRPLNLIRFRARQRDRGVQAKPWGRMRVFPQTFIGNKGRTVFVRSLTRGGGAIRGVFGPGIAKEFISKFNSSNIQRVIEETFIRDFQRRFRTLSAQAAEPANR